MATAPAYVRNGRLDVLAANRLGRAVFAPLLNDRERTPNIARFIFLDPASRDFYVDWERLAGDTVALLRAEAGRDPYDRDLTDLIGALSTRSETFRTWWAAHNVRFHRTGVKHLRHPVVGDLTLAYESMELTADQGLRLNAYSAEPGSPSQDALNVLASWTATLDQQEQPQAARHRRTLTVNHTRRIVEIQPKRPSTKGPAEMFSGDVWFDVIAQGEKPAVARERRPLRARRPHRLAPPRQRADPARHRRTRARAAARRGGRRDPRRRHHPYPARASGTGTAPPPTTSWPTWPCGRASATASPDPRPSGATTSTRVDTDSTCSSSSRSEHALRLGLLEPGDRLPTAAEVVADLAINPNTVLKAYRELERDGLVSARPGVGTFVERGLGQASPGGPGAPAPPADRLDAVGVRRRPRPRGPPTAQCLDRTGLRQRIVYQPADRYVWFQLIEAGLLLGASGARVLYLRRRIGRRLA